MNDVDLCRRLPLWMWTFSSFSAFSVDNMRYFIWSIFGVHENAYNWHAAWKFNLSKWWNVWYKYDGVFFLCCVCVCVVWVRKKINQISLCEIWLQSRIDGFLRLNSCRVVHRMTFQHNNSIVLCERVNAVKLFFSANASFQYHSVNCNKCLESNVLNAIHDTWNVYGS